MNEERTSQDSIPQVVISDEINSLIPMSSDKSETENKPFFKKLLKSLGGITEHDINALIPAEDAYLRATYGKWTNKKVMLKELINKINESIKVRLEDNHLYTLVPVYPEIMDYASQIAEVYKSYGYQAYVLNRESLKKIDSSISVKNTRTLLLILWDKVFE